MLVYIYDQTMVGEYSWASVAFDEDMVERVEVAQLPRDWRSDGTFRSLRAIGDQWALANRSAVLRVPSAIIPMEYNFVINPSHTDSTRIELGQVQDFVLDPRLLRK